MKILIIGPSWVGDMVMSQSLYITLKNKHPKATIDVMAPAWCKPILDRMPEVNNAIEMPLTHGQFSFFERRKLGQALSGEQYDQAYILPNSAKSALIPFFAKIPKRIGWKGEMRYGLLNDLRPNKKSFQYMVERYVALAFPKKQMQDSASLGGLDNLAKPSLFIDADKQLQALKKFNLNQNKPILGLCPGAEFGPSKRWPEEHYAKVANEMINQGYQVFLFGSAKDALVTDKIKSLVAVSNQQAVYNLAGTTNLIEAVDLLAACQTVVSNDSGLMHIAAAVGCRVVAVYGSTSPRYTPPLAKAVEIAHTDIGCRPCFKRTCRFGHLKCLTELQPKQVLLSIQKLNAIKVATC
ncbi:lipopolysaccharide heptosyltransferase II [Psychromonas sp. MB-3u-54]|uniref:lipopolysaccharide heptosyltransferase II n=1 Tax=Psychromonas sp. MB-3u-54 TaxID=2058319 RepID=UPI000C345E7D|nr:lipopolysaccharide heptosyltransferase II [Psychromonas sp. MB-3u-54]PKH01606.1 lipopolysaccharide heptosyltransferase II [Psychromonas sp. MB-3u-54]